MHKKAPYQVFDIITSEMTETIHYLTKYPAITIYFDQQIFWPVNFAAL